MTARVFLKPIRYKESQMANVSDRVNVSFTFEVTNPDGTPYHKTQLQYTGIPYPVLVQMEKILTGALGELNKIGEAQAAVKPSA